MSDKKELKSCRATVRLRPSEEKIILSRYKRMQDFYDQAVVTELSKKKASKNVRQSEPKKAKKKRRRK